MRNSINITAKHLLSRKHAIPRVYRLDILYRFRVVTMLNNIKSSNVRQL